MNGDGDMVPPVCPSGGRAAWGFLRCGGSLAIRELPARCGDVSPAVLADERGHVPPREDLPEALRTIVGGGEEAEPGVLVVGDEVHLRRDVAEQLHQPSGVL